MHLIIYNSREYSKELSLKSESTCKYRYWGSNILKASEYTSPVHFGVWRIRLGRQDNKE